MFEDYENKLRQSISIDLLRSDLKTRLKVENINRHKINAVDLVIQESEYNRFLRSKLKSSDADTVEIHDQFYRDHKFLLVMFRVLAVMPIMRTEPGRMTFSWTSIATIYAVVFWGLMSLVVLIVGKERMNILYTTSAFDEYIYAVIFVIYLVPHFWIPFVGWGVASEVAKYKVLWSVFQLRYYRVTGESLQFPHLKQLIMNISVSCIICAVLFLFSLSFLLEGFPLWHTLAYYHIIIMLNMNCALWFINTKAVIMSAGSMTECFQKDLVRDSSAATVAKYRFLWIELSEILQSLGNAYARTYGTLCIFIFVNVVIALYGTITELLDSKHAYILSYKETGLLVDVIYCSTLLYIICNCSEEATLHLAKGIQETLLSLNLLKSDLDTKKEVDLFIVAIEMNPGVISLKGFVIVNRELLTSSVAKMAVYILVLIQFKFSLDQRTLKG